VSASNPRKQVSASSDRSARPKSLVTSERERHSFDCKRQSVLTSVRLGEAEISDNAYRSAWRQIAGQRLTTIFGGQLAKDMELPWASKARGRAHAGGAWLHAALFIAGALPCSPLRMRLMVVWKAQRLKPGSRRSVAILAGCAAASRCSWL
jgi:hypothetical protein